MPSYAVGKAAGRVGLTGLLPLSLVEGIDLLCRIVTSPRQSLAAVPSVFNAVSLPAYLPSYGLSAR